MRLAARLAVVPAVLLLAIAPPSLAQQVPPLLDYQGLLSGPDGAPVDAALPITFRIYDAETGGQALWTETHSSVDVVGGVFSVRLGAVDQAGNPLTDAFAGWDGSPRWLSVEVDGDGEMEPRQQLVSVPFAMHAQTVGGMTATELASAAAAEVASTALDLAAGTTLDGAPIGTGPGLGDLTCPDDGAVPTFTGGTWQCALPQGGGSSPWSAVGGAGDIAYTSGQVGVGTTAPQALLDVAGTLVSVALAVTDHMTVPSATRPGSFCTGANDGELWFDPADDALHLCSGPNLQKIFDIGGTTTSELEHVLFATGSPVAADFGGLAGADTICAQVAGSGSKTSNLGGGVTWTALVADGFTSIADRVSLQGRVVNANGALVAVDEADLLDGSLAAVAGADQDGVVSSGDVWTGAYYDGAVSGLNCQQWTGTTEFATVGDRTATGAGWLEQTTAPCSGQAHLYCLSSAIETGTEVAAPDSRFQRTIFATSQTWAGSDLQSASQAHALCEAAAAAGSVTKGLKASWFAVLTDTFEPVTANALGYGVGVVKNTAGVMVAPSVGDLWRGVKAPVGADENGAAVTGTAWTGATPAGGSSGEDCGGWDSSGSLGTYGTVTASGTDWLSANYQSCGSQARLYCISVPWL